MQVECLPRLPRTLNASQCAMIVVEWYEMVRPITDDQRSKILERVHQARALESQQRRARRIMKRAIAKAAAQ